MATRGAPSPAWIPSRPRSTHSPARCARAPRAAASAQRVQAAVRKRVAALTSAPAGQLAAADLARALRVLDISLSEAGRLFGVSRSAVEQWLARGIPGRPSRARRESRAHRRHPRAQPQAGAHRGSRARAGGAPTAAKSILDLVRAGRDDEARAACWSRRSTGRARPDAPPRAREGPTCAWSIRPGPTRWTRRSRDPAARRWNPPVRSPRSTSAGTSRPRAPTRGACSTGQPFTFDDLLPERLPALVETDVPEVATSMRVSARRSRLSARPAGDLPADGRGRVDRPQALPGDRRGRLGRGRARGSRAAAPRPARARRRRGARPLRPRSSSAARPPAALRALVPGPADPLPVRSGRDAGDLRRTRGDPAARGDGAVPARHPAGHRRSRSARPGRSGRRSRSSCSPRSGRAERPGAWR